MKNSCSQNFFASLAILACLTACSGMTPGGGAPGEVGGGAVSIGNSLDGGDAPGSGENPLGGGSSGAAVPSTQQSSDAIGFPCVITFKVKVKVLRNGSEQFCNASNALIQADVVEDKEGFISPSEDDSNPHAILNFSYEAPNPITSSKTQNTICVNGRWETSEPFLFGYICSAKTYQVSAQASWRQGYRLVSSNHYQGMPVRESGNYDPIPVEVTIDLGYDPFLPVDILERGSNTQ